MTEDVPDLNKIREEGRMPTEAELTAIREHMAWTRRHTPAEIVERQKLVRRARAEAAARRWLS